MKNISSLNSYNTIDYLKLYQQFSPKSECKQKSLIKMKKYCEPYVLGIIFFFLITVILMLKKKWYASVNHSDACAAEKQMQSQS